MKRYYLLTSILLMLLCLISAKAQNSARAAEIRGSIKILEDIVNNSSIPEQTKQDYVLSLLEKKGQLATLLRQELKDLQEQKTRGGSSDEIAALDSRIKAISNEIKQLVQNKNLVTELKTVPDNSDVSGSVPLNSENTPVTPPATPPNGTGGTSPVADNPQDNSDNEITTIKDRYDLRLKKAVDNIKTSKTSNPRATIIPGRDLVLLLPLALSAKKGVPNAVAELTSQAENARNDKQVGGTSSSSGTTSLVTKGAVPAIFGFAVENGALERTTSGTTVTFRGNPVGIIQSFAKKGYIDSYQNDSTFDRALRNFAFGLSFDTSRGNSSNIFTGDKQQLSAFSFRYNFFNQRDPRDKKYTRLWEKLVSEQSVEVVRVLGVLTRTLLIPQKGQEVPVDFKNWLEETETVIANANLSEVDAKLEIQMEKLQKIPFSPQIEDALDSFATKYKAFLERRNKILGQISNGWLITSEYTNQRPIDSPSISNFNFIAEKGAFNGSIDLTANASFSFFNNKPAGMNTKKFRDFHLSGQLDIPFGDVTRTGIFLFSLAGKYERLLKDQPIPNTMNVIRKGDIGVIQAKLVIPVRGTAFKIPISFSFANRTELLKEKELRGNFGFTFDIDSILARFNPFTSK